MVDDGLLADSGSVRLQPGQELVRKDAQNIQKLIYSRKRQELTRAERNGRRRPNWSRGPEPGKSID